MNNCKSSVARRWPRFAFGGTALAALAISGVNLSAATVSFTSATLGTPTGSWTQTGTVQKFDPSLGTLTKVTVSSSAEIQATIQVENFDAQPVVATAKETATVKVLRPGAQPVAGNYLVLTVSTAEQSVSLDAFDGNGGLVDIFGLPVAQFTGTDSAILGDPNNGGPLVGSDSISVDILPAEFADFTGVLPYSPADLDDQLTLTATASGSAVFTSSGNFGRKTTFSASAGFTVTYEYTPPVETPKDTPYCANAASLLGGATSAALTLPGIATDFLFTTAAGGFTQHSDGTANLFGTLSSASSPNDGFVVNIAITGPLAPVVNPNLVVAGANAADWQNYSGGFSGTLTGVGKFAGGVLSVGGPSFQIGTLGANLKNLTFGGSASVTVLVQTQPSTGFVLKPTGTGSLNMNFTGDGVACSPDNNPCIAKGTKPCGYWKDNPSEWPCEKIKLGNCYYTKRQACDLLKKKCSPSGHSYNRNCGRQNDDDDDCDDSRYGYNRWCSYQRHSDCRDDLEKALCEAKLNCHPKFCNPCYNVEKDICEAEKILCKYPPRTYKCVPKSQEYEVHKLRCRLNDYCNGKGEAPRCKS